MHLRKEYHIDLLWDFFIHVIDADADSLDIELMDRCLSLDGVGMAYLTIGMFWVNPAKFLSTDGKIIKRKIIGLESNLQTATEYQEWLKGILAEKKESNFEFSLAAHEEEVARKREIKRYSKMTSKPQLVKAPFDKSITGASIRNAFSEVGNFISNKSEKPKS